MNAGSILLLLVPLVLLWVLILRPARQRQRQTQSMQSTLAVGQEVMTTSGLFGTVAALDDRRVTLTVAPGVELQFVRAAIGAVERPADAEPDPQADRG